MNVTNPQLHLNNVTFGRYNVTTLAHLHTIKKIAERGHTVVGVISDDMWPLKIEQPTEDALKFISVADSQHLKTTFTAAQRKKMLDLSLKDFGLEHTVSTLVIGRPELDPQYFNELFPRDIYTLCFPAPLEGQLTHFDSERDRLLPIILDRKIHFITTSLTLHTSDIKERAKYNHQEWRSYMSPSAFDYYMTLQYKMDYQQI